MYRFLKSPSSSFSNVLGVPINNADRLSVCCGCLRPYRLSPRDAKLYSSEYAAVLNQLWKKKKKSKKLKATTDVVEVAENSSRVIQHTVGKLKPKQVTAFAEQPGMMLAQNIRKFSNTSRNLLPSDSIKCYDPIIILPVNSVEEFVRGYLSKKSDDTTNLNRFEVRNETLLRQSHLSLTEDMERQLFGLTEEENKQASSETDIEALLNAPVRNVFSHHEHDEIELTLPESTTATQKKPKRSKTSPSLVVGKKKSVTAKVEARKLDEAKREEDLNVHLLSYMDICVDNGMLDDAFKTFKYFYRVRAKGVPRISNVDIYNILLHGFAKQGIWQRIVELESIIRDEGLELNGQSYAAIFECLGRLKDHSGMVKKNYLHYTNLMKLQNMNLDDVFVKTILTDEQKNILLKVIRSMEADFSPAPAPLVLDTECRLLNDTSEPAGSPYSSPAAELLEKIELMERVRQQLVTETNNLVEIKTIERRSEPIETIHAYREMLEETQSNWRTAIDEALTRNLKLLRLQGKRKSLHYLSLYPYLKSLSSKDIEEIVMQEIRRLAEGSETYSPSTSQLNRDLGYKVYLRYRIKSKVMNGEFEKVEELFEKYCDWYRQPSGSATNTRQCWQLLLHGNTDVNGREKRWPNAVLFGVGKFLYNIILRDLKVNVNVMRSNKVDPHLLPAFYSVFRTKGRTQIEEVKPHPILSRLYRAAAPDSLVFDASKIPMLCPPLPWSNIRAGGYLISETDLIRLPFQAVSQWKALENTPPAQLYPALDSLNQLGSIPWTVNEPMLDVVLEVFNSGGSSKLDVPEPPSSLPLPDSVTASMSQAERYQAYKQRLAVRRRKAEMYSLWCDALYKLSLANHFRKAVFWLPHNMDFRGRVYPVPPHLNHLGSDLSRSLLVFAKGKPLGPKGLDWLKIHTINLTGTHKKKSVAERLEYANTVLEDILDSAERPLQGKQWWVKSDEPWQTLAACMEVRAALASGDPEMYVSHFPVHQDGSCNGLQHYAALGRDQVGAVSVNLSPADKPQDVYNCVAQIVERERAKDAATGVEIAKVLDGFVSRKVIKQTVMTTVYGVTRYGARLQIARQLKDLDEFPQQYVWQASTYLVGKTFESLQEMFTSTKEIQDWFTECAKLISQVCGENVEWVTPLGLPIVQPYCKIAKKNPRLHEKFGKVSSFSVDAFERPNVMKQKNAFPPNFIHSLDSSHMMLTSLRCEQAGVTFVSVHDCFWTHACTVDTMNKVCRTQFVALHSQPILEDLSKHFVKRYSYSEADLLDDSKRGLNNVLSQVPHTGTFQLSNVLDSTYFFS